MKAKLTILLMCIGLFACSKKELTKEEALVLLAKGKDYPRTIDVLVSTADPVHARRVLDANLENDGFVLVQRTQKLIDVGKPLIKFTEKARPYLLPRDDKYPETVQRVKAADEKVVEIISITEDKNAGTTEVAYVTNFTNLTPFAALLKNPDRPRNVLSTFKFDGEQWILVRNR